MPLYEYYCERCNGIIEAVRQMREASLPLPCPECNRDASRIMSSFNAFTMRDGYPRRIPDKGTFWHMGQEVKTRVTRMKGWEHPELAKPKPKPRRTKDEVITDVEKRRAQRTDALYRDRWGFDEHGLRNVRAKKQKPERKTIVAG